MSLTTLSLTITAAALAGLYLLYLLSLPTPIPGIPHNATSARRLLGETDALGAHLAATADGTFITYAVKLMRRLNCPLVQVFPGPLRRPILILGDYSEAYNVFARRMREFERSYLTGTVLSALFPNNQLPMRTGAAWKAQARRWAGAMSTSFLRDAVTPGVYGRVGRLVELWRMKSRVAGARPWTAVGDVDALVMEIVMGFTFGDAREGSGSALEGRIRAVQGMSMQRRKDIEEMDADRPVVFPVEMEGGLHPVLELNKAMADMRGAFIPSLKRAAVLRRQSVKDALKAQTDYIQDKIKEAVQWPGAAKSVVDIMVAQEREQAKMQEREPDYFSRAMIDQYLTEHPQVQDKLRRAIEATLDTEKYPSLDDILNASIPYLDATVEEILRFANPTTAVDREALVDTQILGHAVPKGTIVICILTEPGMTSRGLHTDNEHDTANRPSWDQPSLAQFSPERWLVQGEKGEQFHRDAAPQMAFGLGPRACSGRKLAYLVMRAAVAAVVWNFELMACPPRLSGFRPWLGTVKRPEECYLRLREIRRGY
ncbi:cytochrome P450 monooxygenase [Aspergillus egyptiacus]|nr:cytochrome P450 monooxygenase [Aspergillus egyptiacus]